MTPKVAILVIHNNPQLSNSFKQAKFSHFFQKCSYGHILKLFRGILKIHNSVEMSHFFHKVGESGEKW
jgi:hypothetical protein